MMMITVTMACTILVKLLHLSYEQHNKANNVRKELDAELKFQILMPLTGRRELTWHPLTVSSGAVLHSMRTTRASLL